MTARLGVTGSRLLTDHEHGKAITAGLTHCGRLLGRDTVLVHGACPPATRTLKGVKTYTHGADWLAVFRWRIWGLPTEGHPADWSRLGIRAGFVRNAEMAKAGADLWIAFPYPDEEVESKGTWHMVGCCLAESITVLDGWTLCPITTLPEEMR